MEILILAFIALLLVFIGVMGAVAFMMWREDRKYDREQAEWRAKCMADKVERK